MKTVPVALGERSYNIRIGAGLLDKAGERLKRLGLEGSGIMVTDRTVNGLYGDRALSSLKEAGFNAGTYILPSGERHKNLGRIGNIYSRMLELGLGRDSFVLSLGGGVVGDTAGFAAATYMRGVNFIQVPTTLLAQVDASAGGKVGVNLPQGKNLIGSFYQPRCVLIDPTVLRTLDRRDFYSGFAEVIKHAVIRDSGYFSYLEENRDKALSVDPDKRSCEIKAEIVSRDETEKKLRMILNFGHTIGHAIESATSYKKYKHGEAVAAGMACACSISVLMGYLNQAEKQRIDALLASYNLPFGLEGVSADKIAGCLFRDKKVRGGRVQFVLLRKIGEVFITDEVPEKIVLAAITELGRSKP
jgi:3-dehydroquinate synthase